MICQYRGSDLCPNCPKCRRDIKLELGWSEDFLSIDFNLHVFQRQSAQPVAKSVFISEQLAAKIASRFSLSPQQSLEISPNTFLVLDDKPDRDLFFQASPVEIRFQLTLKKLFSVADFVELMDEVFAADALQGKHPNNPESGSTSAMHKTPRLAANEQAPAITQPGDDSAPDKADCSMAQVFLVELEATQLKYVIDGVFPRAVRVVVVRPNTCVAGRQVLGTRVFKYSKSVGVTIVLSFFQSVIFSALNHLDILGLFYYVHNHHDALLDRLMRVVSGFDCSKSFSYCTHTASLESNRQILQLLRLGRHASDRASRDWPRAKLEARTEHMIATSNYFYHAHYADVAQCSHQVTIEESFGALASVAYLCLALAYHVHHWKTGRREQLALKLYALVARATSISLYWLFFSNLMVFLAKIQLIKASVFGALDFAVCLARAVMMVLPHFISASDLRSLEEAYKRNYSRASFRRISMRTTARIDYLRKQIYLNQNKLQQNKSAKELLQQQSRKSDPARSGYRDPGGYSAANREVEKDIEYYNRKLLNTIRDPQIKLSNNFDIVYAKYVRDIQRLSLSRE